MKALTTKEYVSLAGIVITAPVLALGVVLASATVASGHELLLLALTLCGAVVSGINGFGRRTTRSQISIAQKPRRATINRGPQIMSLTGEHS
jgi:hypothetical protein